MKINIIILMSVLIWFSICNIQKQSPIINVKFSQQIKSLSQLLQNKQSVLTFQNFINQLKQNPQRLSQVGNIYITGWPILQQQKVKTFQPKISQTGNSIKDSQPNFTGLKTQTNQKGSISSNIRQIANPNINGKNQVKIQDIQNKNTKTQPTKMSLDSSIAYCAELTNDVRTKYNVPKLQINPLLNKIAQAHSEDMVRRRFFSHTNPDGETVGDRAKKNNYTGMIGQNLAQAMSFQQAWDGFLNSPGHFQNQINPDWQNIGVGIAVTNSGVLFITVLFSPKDIARNALTNQQLQKSLDSLSQGIINSSPNLKTVDKILSSYIQQWLQNSSSMSILDYVIRRGKYRTPMSVAQYVVDYSNDFVSRVIQNRYFANPNPMLTKFGIGMKQEGQKLSIYVIYM